MGLDFIRKAAKSYKKSQDKARAELATSDLLTRSPELGACTGAFDMTPRTKLACGERVTVEPDGSQLVARQGLSEVARASAPTEKMLKAVKDSCGVASGKIEHVHDIAGVTEISIC